MNDLVPALLGLGFIVLTLVMAVFAFRSIGARRGAWKAFAQEQGFTFDPGSKEIHGQVLGRPMRVRHLVVPSPFPSARSGRFEDAIVLEVELELSQRGLRLRTRKPTAELRVSLPGLVVQHRNRAPTAFEEAFKASAENEAARRLLGSDEVREAFAEAARSFEVSVAAGLLTLRWVPVPLSPTDERDLPAALAAAEGIVDALARG